MPRYALLIEYDGAPFHGWQRQSGVASVQARIETALAALGPPPRIFAAGRTDTGVHATGQVAHVDLMRDWDPFRLTGALNHHLRPEPIAILAAARVDPAFHARFSARRRTYVFRIAAGRRAPLVLDRDRLWRVGHPLDADAMRAGAAALIGRHDFTTFRSVMCQADSPVRTLDRIEITTHPLRGGQEVRLQFEARSFLHNQVRSLVGTLERVGAGAWTPARVGAALAARERSACGPVSPPGGLTLTAVDYPTDPFADHDPDRKRALSLG